MKRYGNLWPAIIDRDNLRTAHANARRGKTWQRGVQAVDATLDERIEVLVDDLVAGRYRTAA